MGGLTGDHIILEITRYFTEFLTEYSESNEEACK